MKSRLFSFTESALSASTPFVVPEPNTRVLISEEFPRITSNLNFFISSRAVFVRKELAPTPTGSNNKT